MICEGLLPSHIRPIRGPALVDNSPAALVRTTLLQTLIPQEFTIASYLTVYPEQSKPRVELDLEITAGSYNAKVNLLGVLQLNFN